jgi:hypothetical protein
MKIVHKLASAAALAALVASAGASAEDPQITGKKNVICASQDIMACVDDAVCMQGKPSTFEMPTFMFVDVKTKTIRAVDQDGTSVTSPIKTHEVTEVSAIMQGYENHRGWTLAIDKMDGSFTLSATGPDVNFMMMGACTQL